MTPPDTIEKRHIRRGQRRSIFHPNPAHLVPPGARYVPKPIAEANTAARKAYESMVAASATAKQLAEEAKAAPRFDQRSAEISLEAGEEPPPSTIERKRAKAEEAERNASAALNVARRRVADLFDAVAENYPEWLVSRERAHAEALRRVRAALPELAEGFPLVAAELGQLIEAQRWENNPASHALSSTRTPDHFQRRLASEREAVAKRLANRLGAPKASDVPRLIAELEHAVADGT